MMIREDAELHRAQRAFRSVLDAFARPGTVQSIELAPGNPARPAALDAALEAATRLFVDQAVTFCVADSETDATTAYLTSETHARRARRCAARAWSARTASPSTAPTGCVPATRGATSSPAASRSCWWIRTAAWLPCRAAPRATLLDVKQSAQGGATREQMFHVKHSEAAPWLETGASVAGGASSASAEDRAFSVSAASAVGCASAAKEVR